MPIPRRPVRSRRIRCSACSQWTKSFTNALVLRAIEMGQFAFHTKIKDVIPQFAGKAVTTSPCCTC